MRRERGGREEENEPIRHWEASFFKELKSLIENRLWLLFFEIILLKLLALRLLFLLSSSFTWRIE